MYSDWKRSTAQLQGRPHRWKWLYFFLGWWRLLQMEWHRVQQQIRSCYQARNSVLAVRWSDKFFGLALRSLFFEVPGFEWLHAVNKLPSLTELYLDHCKLESLPTSLPLVNLTCLFALDLSYNQFNSSIPQWLVNLTSLTTLYLRFNYFQDTIPFDFVNLEILGTFIWVEINTSQVNCQAFRETFVNWRL